ncbi:hypothetical protein BU26DRAFT_566726 [Trematosphaeria pertusa]|uniref:Transmembrane protein n=1 Tax=Trematosphaeria pertusa TaxID=390896 RepID=A0A6A6ID08_9PLEO|nr:uncharacterized protein BU26DRAFT_566726 [Trematosphaeria pertusa]KAF2247782.1 hypothetical protein BU26DRAFT_566726 [Trematosphaeria pertusa]
MAWLDGKLSFGIWWGRKPATANAGNSHSRSNHGGHRQRPPLCPPRISNDEQHVRAWERFRRRQRRTWWMWVLFWSLFVAGGCVLAFLAWAMGGLDGDATRRLLARATGWFNSDVPRRLLARVMEWCNNGGDGAQKLVRWLMRWRW